MEFLDIYLKLDKRSNNHTKKRGSEQK